VNVIKSVVLFDKMLTVFKMMKCEFNFAGKTALHWAGAVNNVDAVVVLLQHGANRDAQDTKDQTPLFLVAREGSYEAGKMLLDNNANTKIKDNMDELPRDIAYGRMNYDIMRLLDENRTKSPAIAMAKRYGSRTNMVPYVHSRGSRKKGDGQQRDRK
jgi:ankyrin repeat protein